MTKEQEIYKNMKRRGRIFKSHGKWGIPYHKLYCAIKEAGYGNGRHDDYKIINAIIDNMVDKGYIRKTYGNTMDYYAGNYIILKWVN